MKRLPPAFLIAVALHACFSVAQLYAFWGDTPTTSFWSWVIAASGASFAYAALVACGLFELADRSQGPGRRAEKVAAWVFVATIAWKVVNVVLRYIWFAHDSETTATLMHWTGSIVGLAAAIALLTAVFYRGHVGLAIAAFVCVVIANPIPPVERWFFRRLGNDWAGFVLLVAELTMWTLALTCLARSTDESAELAEDPRRAQRGFELAAFSLWLRIAGLVAAVMFVLFAASGQGRGAVDVLKACLFGAPLLGAVSLAMLAHGAFAVARNGHRGVTAFAASVTGALAAFVAGATVAQAPWIYGMLYKSDRDHSYYVADTVMEAATALPTVLPIVGSAALLGIVIVIARWASRRGDTALSARAAIVALMFVLLMIVNIGVQAHVAKAKNVDSALALAVLAAIAGLTAVISVMRLCRAAANAAGAAPALPIATALPPRES